MNRLLYALTAYIFYKIAWHCGHLVEYIGFSWWSRILDYYISDLLLVPACGSLLFVFPFLVLYGEEEILRICWYICQFISFTIAMITEFSTDPTWCYNSKPGDPIDIIMYIIGISGSVAATSFIGKLFHWDDA